MSGGIDDGCSCGSKYDEFRSHMIKQNVQFANLPEPKEWPCAICGKLVMHSNWWLETTVCEKCRKSMIKAHARPGNEDSTQ